MSDGRIKAALNQVSQVVASHTHAAKGDTWYRYYDYGVGEDVFIGYEKFTVVKVTPKGVWLTPRGYTGSGYSDMRFWTSAHTHKRKAYPTRDMAWESFRRRKESQLRFLRDRHDTVQTVLEIVKKQGTAAPERSLVHPEAVGFQDCLDEDGFFTFAE